MSITLAPVTASTSVRSLRTSSHLSGALVSAALTPLAFGIIGYHPFAEDGGLYLAGVKLLLHPSLFPLERAFVLAPMHYSLFAPFVAAVIHFSGLRFETAVLTLFLLALWATIFAGWTIARVCFTEPNERYGATGLFALWLGLPVAGTSLMLVDPYLTARSLSTPFVLIGLAQALSACMARRSGDTGVCARAVAWAAACFVCAAAFHPLMSGYGTTFALTMAWLEGRSLPRRRLTRTCAVLAAALALAAIIQCRAPAEPAAYTAVAMTRRYWYLAHWEWFEWLGLVAPLLLLAVPLLRTGYTEVRILSRTGVLVGCSALAVSLCFARVALAPMGVAHLQPLRVFQVIYAMLFLLLGGWAGRTLLRYDWRRWTCAAIVLGGPALLPSLANEGPTAAHIEVPTSHPARSIGNPWVDAFRWIAKNTPPDALFALDADYTTQPAEDAQSFRAIAERSALPDAAKDGGETSVAPELSDLWTTGASAQRGLSGKTDAERQALLQPLDVSWVVLRANAATGQACPYRNRAVQVCRLEQSPQAAGSSASAQPGSSAAGYKVGVKSERP